MQTLLILPAAVNKLRFSSVKSLKVPRYQQFLAPLVSSLYASIFQINAFCTFGLTSDSKLIFDRVEMSRSKEGPFVTNKKEIFCILIFFSRICLQVPSNNVIL